MFYTRLKELRIEHHMTQQAVADILEIKHPQYHRYESGKREIPLHLLIKLADFYGVTLDYIAGRSNESGTEELGNIG